MIPIAIDQMRGQQRAAFLAVVEHLVRIERITMGQALRVLRAGFLGMSRAEYAERVGVSERELAKLETDRGNPTVRTLNRVFGPFGWRVGLVRRKTAGIDAIEIEVAPEDFGAIESAIHQAIARNRRK